MRGRIEKLQSRCKHEEISGWMDYWWVPGYSAGYKTKVCGICGKIVDRKDQYRDTYAKGVSSTFGKRYKTVKLKEK